MFVGWPKRIWCYVVMVSIQLLRRVYFKRYDVWHTRDDPTLKERRRKVNMQQEGTMQYVRSNYILGTAA